MRNIIFIFIFVLMSTISHAAEIEKSPSGDNKSLNQKIENSNSTNLSPELAGAIYGALAAGSVTLLLTLGGWFFNRRILNKKLRIGLYFEIENHKIVDLPKETDNQPNFALTNFNDNFYRSNLSEITKIFNENLIQRIVFYYSHLKLAHDFQEEISKTNEKIKERQLTTEIEGNDLRIRMLREKKKDFMNATRLLLGTTQFIRHNLLAELTKIFKEDPTKLTFIDVMPEHREWFEAIQKKRGVT